MRILASSVMILIVTGCASTTPVEEVARLAGEELLRLETELTSATDVIEQRLERRRELTETRLSGAQEAERLKGDLQREWQVAGNDEAIRMYTAIVQSRRAEAPPIRWRATSTNSPVQSMSWSSICSTRAMPCALPPKQMEAG